MADPKLPIRRLTLYKHGVGFVEREGTLQENDTELELVFRQSEVNDALKSLLVIDQQGGPVRGIHYETPGGQFPDDNRLSLSPDNSLLDLLKSLRGRSVQLTLGEGTTGREITGRLLGVEVDPDRPLTRSVVAILEESADTNSHVLSLPLVELRSVTLLEERANQDLRFFLDSSRSDEAHRTITLQLDNAQAGHTLNVSYLVPCPTWRVSYRLLAEIKPPEAPAEGVQDRQGELLLQGWGLFDNRLEEDLQDVSVRLVAGQPISFIYDLTTSRIPVRPVVQDEARVAPGPVQFEEALPEMDTMSFGGYAPAAAPMMAAAPMGRARSGPAQSRKQMLQAEPAAAKGAALGELFQYEVTTPVTVKRGESALVPILNNTLPYRHELLYNGQKMPTHPVANLRFKNETGLVLERGPVTVVEDNDYRGEALVNFTPVGGEVYLAYSVELGVKVTEEQTSRTETTGIRLGGSYLYFNNVTILTTTYQLENTLGEPRMVTIEKPTRTSYELTPTTTAPSEKTAEFYRWKVPCQARVRTVFTVEERMFNWHTEEVLNQDYRRLSEYLTQNWLDEQTLNRIKAVLDENNQIQQNQKEITELEIERNDLYRRQEQLRQNMSALSTTGDEAKLRRQVFEQLASTEERINAIGLRWATLKTENVQRQENLKQLLDNLK